MLCFVCVAPQQPENKLREQSRCILKCRIEVCCVCFLFVVWFCGGSLISIRPIWVYRGAAAGIALVGIPAVQRVTGSVLAAMPTAVRIVLLDDRWLLLDNLQMCEIGWDLLGIERVLKGCTEKNVFWSLDLFSSWSKKYC